MSIRVWSVAFGLCFALPLQAQVIRGRVLLPDSTTPVAGVVITAIAASGTEAARALSTSAGTYVLRLPLSGQYSLRALHIGFRPTTIDGVDVGARDTTERTIVVTGLPVSIATVTVRDRGRCDMRARDSETLVQLWGQARAALAAAQLTELDAALELQVVRVSGHMDAITYGTAVGRGTLGTPHIETDTASAEELIVSRAFATTAADTLLQSGYVRRNADGRVVFDAPNAEVLLSDPFAAHHCFSITNGPEQHRDWIGIGFTPQHDVGDVVGIRGTFWLDRSSAELRRIDFDYTNLPNEALRLCEQSRPGKPTCSDFNNDRNRLGLGGTMSLERLSSGEWLTDSWTMRLPPDGFTFRKSHRLRMVNRQPEACYYGKDCQDVYAGWPRLVTTTGTVTRMLRGRTELYRNDGSTPLVAAAARKRAGARPAHLAGVITHGDGTPLMHAVVQAGAPSRAAFTDSTGAFLIRTLPAVSTTVSVRCRGYSTASFTITLLPDSTRRVTMALEATDAAAPVRRECSSPH